MSFSYKMARIATLAGLAAVFLCSNAIAADPIRVKVASTNKEVFDNLPLYVALHAGMFKKENLAVEITHFAGGGEVVRAIASGSMDIGMVATTAAIIAVGRGESLRMISAYSAPAYGILFVVQTDSPIKTVKDLVGKKAGISRPGSVSHTGLNAALQAHGIQGQVEAVPVGGSGDGWAVLKSGRIQATHHTAPDVYSLIDRGEARILFQLSEFLKNYQQGALVALDGYLGKNGETTRKFLRAVAEAAKFIDQNPAEATRIGAKGMGTPEPAMRATIDAMPAGFFRIGVPESKNFEASMAEALGSGALKTAPAYDKVVDRRFLP